MDRCSTLHRFWKHGIDILITSTSEGTVLRTEIKKKIHLKYKIELVHPHFLAQILWLDPCLLPGWNGFGGMLIGHGHQQALFTFSLSKQPLNTLNSKNNEGKNESIIVEFFIRQYELIQLVWGFPTLTGENLVHGRLTLFRSWSSYEFPKSLCRLLMPGPFITPTLILGTVMLSRALYKSWELLLDWSRKEGDLARGFYWGGRALGWETAGPVLGLAPSVTVLQQSGSQVELNILVDVCPRESLL